MQIVYLVGIKRLARGAALGPSNTEKGVKELSELGHDVTIVDPNPWFVHVRKLLPDALAKKLCMGWAVLHLLRLRTKGAGAIYTSSHPWIRLLVILKSFGLLNARIVARWTANDVAYGELNSGGPFAQEARRVAEHIDGLWMVSVRERDMWRAAFPSRADRFAFWPTPVDLQYYRDRLETREENEFVVAVGSDYKRDWKVPIELARRGVKTLLLTEDPKVEVLARENCTDSLRLEFAVGFDRSARIMAGCRAIILSTLENDRFSGSTTVGVAAALGKPLLIDEAYDLEAYGLYDDVNCLSFERGVADSAHQAARRVVDDRSLAARLSTSLAEVAGNFSISVYAEQLERSLSAGWKSSDADAAWKELVGKARVTTVANEAVG